MDQMFSIHDLSKRWQVSYGTAYKHAQRMKSYNISCGTTNRVLRFSLKDVENYEKQMRLQGTNAGLLGVLV